MGQEMDSSPVAKLTTSSRTEFANCANCSLWSGVNIYCWLPFKMGSTLIMLSSQSGIDMGRKAEEWVYKRSNKT